LPDRLLHLATALWRIRPDRRWPLAAIDVLGSASEPIERQEAAEALHDVRDPGAVQALVKALDDPEPLVRYHAARGLFAIHGLSAESKDPQHMLYRLMADEASRREGGKRDILAAVAAAPASEPADRGGAGT
jgi:HEAT repeat protein